MCKDFIGGHFCERNGEELGKAGKASQELVMPSDPREKAGKWIGEAWTVLESLEGSARSTDSPPTSHQS